MNDCEIRMIIADLTQYKVQNLKQLKNKAQEELEMDELKKVVEIEISIEKIIEHLAEVLK